MKTLDATQTALLAQTSLVPVSLLEIHTFLDRSAGVAGQIHYIAERWVRYNSLQWLPYLQSVRIERSEMRHLPDDSFGDSSLIKRLQVRIRNATDEAGVRFGFSLLQQTLEGSTIVWRELMVDPTGTSAPWDFSALTGSEDTVRFRGDVHQIVSVTNESLEIECRSQAPTIQWQTIPNPPTAADLGPFQNTAAPEGRDVGARRTLVFGEIKNVRLQSLVRWHRVTTLSANMGATATTFRVPTSESDGATTGIAHIGTELMNFQFSRFVGADTEFLLFSRSLDISHDPGTSVRMYASIERFALSQSGILYDQVLDSGVSYSINGAALRALPSGLVQVSSDHIDIRSATLRVLTAHLDAFPETAAAGVDVQYFANIRGVQAVGSSFIAAAGVLLEEMPDIIRFVLTALCGVPTAELDSGWNAIASSLGASNKHTLILNETGAEFIEVVSQLAFESRLNLTIEETATGQVFRLLASTTDYSWGTPVQTLTEWSQVSLAGVPAAVRETRARFVYDRDFQLEPTESGFREAFVLSPDESPLVRPSTTNLIFAERTFGRRDAPARFFSTIADLATIKDVAGYYAYEKTRTTPVAREVTIVDSPWSESFQLEQGDIVKLTPEWDSRPHIIRLTDVVHDSVRQMNRLRGVVVAVETTISLEMTEDGAAKLTPSLDLSGGGNMIVDVSFGLTPSLDLTKIAPDLTTALLGGYQQLTPGRPNSNEAHVCSLEFDGTKALNSASGTLGIANAWTVAIPVRFDTVTNQAIFTTGPTANSIRIALEASGTVLTVELYDSGGTLFKRYQWGVDATGTPLVHWLVDDWALLSITWNGTNLVLYWNGVAATADSTPTDNAGTMTDTARQIYVGETASSTNRFDGRIHSVAIWNVALDASTNAALFNHGAVGWINLAADSVTDYSQSPALKHWYRFGKDPTSLGKDFVLTASRDLSTIVGGITVADVRADCPDGVFLPFGLHTDAVRNSDSLGTTANALGIANVWSIAFIFWLASRHNGTVFDRFPDSGSANQILFEILTAPDRMRILLKDTTSADVFKQYEFPIPPLSEWQSCVLTWTGTTLEFWRNGELVTPSAKIVDVAGSLTDVSSKFRFGTNNSSSVPFDGRLHSCALWDVVLPDVSIRDVFFGGKFIRDLNFDRPTLDVGYKESANLKHWWVFGQPVSDSFTGGEIATDRVTSGGLGIEALTGDTPAGGRINTTTEHRVAARGVGSGCMLRLNGTDEYLVTVDEDLLRDDMWAVAFPFKPDDLVGAQSLVYLKDERDSNADDSARIFLDGSELVVMQWDQAGNLNKHYRVPSVVAAGVLSHIIVTYERRAGLPTRLRIFHNGAELTGSAITRVENQDGEGGLQTLLAFVGSSQPAPSALFAGLIGRVTVWTDTDDTEVITPNQAAEVFAGRNAYFFPTERDLEVLDATAANNVLHEWTFDLMSFDLAGSIGTNGEAEDDVDTQPDPSRLLNAFGLSPAGNLVIGGDA